MSTLTTLQCTSTDATHTVTPNTPLLSPPRRFPTGKTNFDPHKIKTLEYIVPQFVTVGYTDEINHFKIGKNPFKLSF